MDANTSKQGSRRVGEPDRDDSNGWLKWVLALALIAILVVVGFLLLGGDADVDVDSGEVDIEAPDVDADIEAPDVDLEAPDVDVEAGEIDVDDADVEVDADADDPDSED